jgi:diaminohydroxyphosphoribosylaminopyrimidine deaminase/5-amino-6-(5-phosphoribosylamino)uracil reductase
VSISRALRLVDEAGPVGYPKPTVGAVVVRDGDVVGEGVTEPGGRHGEVVALAAAGDRARGATLYVTLEPCAHHGTTPPCTDAIEAAGIERVVFAAYDPNPEAAGGEARLRGAGVDVEYADWREARVQNEAWRTWVAERRPFVILKLATTLDGRVTVPGQRWVSGEASRRRVHELRAAVDAVAVGAGTLRDDRPRLDARDVETPKGQPRRLVFSRRELETHELEARQGSLGDELAALAADGVQSLLLEGGPTLAAAFLAEDLVDKVLLFVAPTLAGSDGLASLAALPCPRTLSHLSSTAVGDDVLLEAYVHDP